MKILARIWQRVNAAQISVLSFGGFILLGGVVLWLPFSTTGAGVSFIDALFTATSATCVTGLTVVDTGTSFTAFGQGYILFMIQMGGLGITLFSTFILMVIGRKLPTQISDATADSYLKLRRYSLWELVRATIIMTFAIEAVGAVMILSDWLNYYPPGEAVWLSVFHSVSAYCNAGFSLFPDNLVGRVEAPYINVTFQILIIMGGLGFFVLFDLWERIKGHPDIAKRRLSFHTKIVMSLTLILVPGGALLIGLSDWNQELARFDPGHKVLHALFQSVTARTCGFNSVNIGSMTNMSIFILIFLMFIGGAPGSCAGGVKVTTFGVILIVVLSRLRGRAGVSLFGRSISRGNMERAVTLIILSAALVIVITMALSVTELHGHSPAESRAMPLENVFETVSAFGTVGLTLGLTPRLTAAGKIFIIGLMFVGRLGPLTLMFALERRRMAAAYRYPDEQILIG